MRIGIVVSLMRQGPASIANTVKEVLDVEGTAEAINDPMGVTRYQLWTWYVQNVRPEHTYSSRTPITPLFTTLDS
jgi:hypothetical protein